MTPDRLVQLMRHVRRDPEGCWDWIGALDREGYGNVRLAGVNRRAHRVIYEAKVGPIPEGAVLHHVCHNRRCVRPDHLEPMTPVEHSRQHVDRAGRPPKTHCKRGHPFDEVNTQYHGPNRARVCGECSRARDRRRKAERLAKIAATQPQPIMPTHDPTLSVASEPVDPNRLHRMVAMYAKKARDATVRRDQEIRKMRGEGASLRVIAVAAKLSPTAIAKILAR